MLLLAGQPNLPSRQRSELGVNLTATWYNGDTTMKAKLNIHGVTLEGFAQGGVQTSIFVPEARAMFDVGVDIGAPVDDIFVTHGHPDHIGALHSVVARRITRKNSPAPGKTLKPLRIHVPAGIAQGVSAALSAMDGVFGDRHRPVYEVVAHVPGGAPIDMGHHIHIEPVHTFHGVASCGWVVKRLVKKLKPEFAHLSGKEIGDLARAGHEVGISQWATELVVPGDTMIDFLIRSPEAQRAKVLLHEVTFWDDKSSVEKCRAFGHTHVDEMIEHCEKFCGAALVLVHRSMRYTRQECEAIVKRRFPAAMLPKIHMFDDGQLCKSAATMI